MNDFKIEKANRIDTIEFILNNLEGYSPKVVSGVNKLIDDFIQIGLYKTVFQIKGYMNIYFAITVYHEDEYRFTVEIVDEDYLLYENP